MTTNALLRHDADGIATLTLNRPDKFNALSGDLIAALETEVAGLADDRSARVVVIAANGRAFCAGHDLGELRALSDVSAAQRMFERTARLMLDLTRLPQPVIARVHGLTAAAGCQLVAQCDLALAAAEARFATSGISLGLFCSTPGVPLARNLPRKMAMEMLLTGDFVDAETALDLGLVNRVAPGAELDDMVGEFASKLLAKSPAAIAMGKQAFYRQIDQDLGSAYEGAARAMAENLLTEDAQAGIAAFTEKRPMPRWTGR